MATVLSPGPAAATGNSSAGVQRIQVGTGGSKWIWSADGWDLTHADDVDGASSSPTRIATLHCELSNVKIDPQKSALVIVDMQNISLNEVFSLPNAASMYEAESAIIRHAIPAARMLGLQIIWLNWGLTEYDLLHLPPAEVRVMAFSVNTEKLDYGMADPRGDVDDPEHFLTCGERPNLSRIPGAELGEVVLDDGVKVDAGRAMMRGSWNTALHGPLAAAYEAGKVARRPDVWFDKDRNSGLAHDNSPLESFLREQNIRTLLFSGINTDQCVGATLQDANARGYDTILLKDGCATDSPPYAKASYEFNCARAWGFLSSCKALAKAAGLDY
ncbi:hypothetical protein KC343_g1091 [Hortaea werneckii]|uniref:Isochorismatase-like domain-containing protein n=1 Tax=Hortaea werneckii TaxID=91943 RepID=A0A3M7GIE9_HORWE|nr:hypothetical protein KC352_g4093 [Hortaea werneckii]KAI7572868.1 hypothetical protein KC317_g382 [Hortaea werneckii]KAI7628191.1 hypothetical protein KC346_g338 [Hortaea werneckii]KAI7636757.1 hypothetical protein KC343_g1091 [Hortaea werneckii]KAI7640059.1 hypothetical protein KC319_g14136 [Hortaea werneckii]